MAEADEAPAPSARRLLLLGGGFALVSAGAAAVTPRSPLAFGERTLLTALVPAEVGEWSRADALGDVVPERVEGAEPTDRTLLARYAAPGRPDIMLAASYHAPSSRDVKVHRPEVCYESAGFRVVDPWTAPLALAPHLSIPARGFIGVRGLRREQVLYWTRVAAAFPTTASEQRWATIRFGLQGRSVDGLLIRLSTLSSDAQARRGLLAPFAARLFAQAGPDARLMMLGPVFRSAAADQG